MITSGGFERSLPGAEAGMISENAYGLSGPAVHELASALFRRCRDGVEIDLAGWNDNRSRIDIIVSGLRERLGIVCDAVDMERLRRNATLLETAFVHRVLGCSALDAMMDPEAVADAIARAAPSLFRVASRKSRRRSISKLVVLLPGRSTRVAEVPALPSKSGDRGITAPRPARAA